MNRNITADHGVIPSNLGIRDTFLSGKLDLSRQATNSVDKIFINEKVLIIISCTHLMNCHKLHGNL